MRPLYVTTFFTCLLVVALVGDAGRNVRSTEGSSPGFQSDGLTNWKFNMLSRYTNGEFEWLYWFEPFDIILTLHGGDVGDWPSQIGAELKAVDVFNFALNRQDHVRKSESQFFYIPNGQPVKTIDGYAHHNKEIGQSRMLRSLFHAKFMFEDGGKKLKIYNDERKETLWFDKYPLTR